MDGARAQRTGRAHLRVPVDEMIFASFYQLWAAGDPQGRLVGERRFSLVFAPFQKVTRRARDWLRKNRLDRFFTSAGVWRAPEG